MRSRAQVTGYKALIERMACDPKDKHELAAAVRANAEVLVTFNDKHFPELATTPYDVVVVTPDDFLLDQLDLYPGITVGALRAQVEGVKVTAYEHCGAPRLSGEGTSPQFRSGGPAASATADLNAVRQGGCSPR